jgi:hypothetical protein
VSEKVTTQKQTTISFLLHHNIELSVHPLNCEFFSNISISLFFTLFFYQQFREKQQLSQSVVWH